MMKRYLTLAALILLLCGCTDIKNGITPPASYTEEAIEAAAVENIADIREDTRSSVPESTPEISPAASTPEVSLTESGTGEEEDPPPAETPPGSETSPLTGTVHIVCAGDNLIHAPIYRLAEEAAGGSGYDFSPAYEHLGTLISDADLAILNQETILSDDFEPSTWPFFCTPTAMARDMTALGFDAFSIANNHVLDKGEAGLISTLGFWHENYPDIPVYGAYLNEADMNDIRTSEVNGVRFAFLGYMEHTNGLMLPEDSECRITYLSDEAEIERQIKQARAIADCVVVSAHFGIEVSSTITGQQRTLSQKFADWGADIIIGTQPHTIQSMEYLDTADGRKAFVFYCLGNFISTMDDPLAMAEMLGCITVTKDDDGITLSDAYAVPLVDHYDSGYTYVGVYPLTGYTRELADKHAVNGFSYDFILRLFRANIPPEFMDKQSAYLFGE